MACRKQGWHPRIECENTEVEEARRFRKLNSDLFNTREIEVPVAQKQMYETDFAPTPNQAKTE